MPTATAPTIQTAESLYLSRAVSLGAAEAWADASVDTREAALAEATDWLNERINWLWEGDPTPEQVHRAIAKMALYLLRDQYLTPAPVVRSERTGPLSTVYEPQSRAAVPDDVLAAIGDCGVLRSRSRVVEI